MHASIWQFSGDPDDLLRRYDAMTAEIPTAGMRMHACLRAPDGIVILDTCPTREDHESFVETFRALRERHGLPDPAQLDDYPVHVAFIEGKEER